MRTQRSIDTTPAQKPTNIDPKLDRKSFQNRPKVKPKSTQSRPKIEPNWVQDRFRRRPRHRHRFWTYFAPKLGPIWGRFGGQVGVKLGPCWLRDRLCDGPGGRSETTLKFDAVQNRFGINFEPIWEPNMEPRSVQDRFQERSCSKCKYLQIHRQGRCF